MLKKLHPTGQLFFSGRRAVLAPCWVAWRRAPTWNWCVGRRRPWKASALGIPAASSARQLLRSGETKGSWRSWPGELGKLADHMQVSQVMGPLIIHFNGIFHYKPTFFGDPPFTETPSHGFLWQCWDPPKCDAVMDDHDWKNDFPYSSGHLWVFPAFRRTHIDGDKSIR